MKLQDYSLGGVTVDLPNELLWVDEFQWNPIQRKATRSCTGALVIQEGVKQIGRPITLEGKDDMGWVPRSVVRQLHEWKSTEDLKLKLKLEYPEDTREFYVMFSPEQQNPLESKPVKGIPGHNDGDYFTVTLKLIEVQP